MPNVIENGVLREMTADEIAELEELTKNASEMPVSTEERLDEIESAMMELATLLGGESDG